MRLADELLQHALMLLTIDPTRPKQVHLRRAVSAAYYSLFHLLVREAAIHFARMLGGGEDTGLVARLGRTFRHGDMKNVSKLVSKKAIPPRIGWSGADIPAALISVADSFVSLQQARHKADYETIGRFTRNEARELVDEAQEAIDTWRTMGSEATHWKALYLLGFELWDTWKKDDS